MEYIYIYIFYFYGIFVCSYPAPYCTGGAIQTQHLLPDDVQADQQQERRRLHALWCHGVCGRGGQGLHPLLGEPTSGFFFFNLN